jgi:hypothetical protein
MPSAPLQPIRPLPPLTRVGKIVPSPAGKGRGEGQEPPGGTLAPSPLPYADRKIAVDGGACPCRCIPGSIRCRPGRFLPRQATISDHAVPRIDTSMIWVSKKAGNCQPDGVCERPRIDPQPDKSQCQRRQREVSRPRVCGRRLQGSPAFHLGRRRLQHQDGAQMIVQTDRAVEHQQDNQRPSGGFDAAAIRPNTGSGEP